MVIEEKEIKRLILTELDKLFNETMNDNEDECNEEELSAIESVFMSYRNVIAGTDWDGTHREYERHGINEKDDRNYLPELQKED